MDKRVEEYFLKFPKKTQLILKELRKAIMQLEPLAQETMGYGVASFKFKENQIYYAAFKEHIGLYPTPPVIIKFKKELEGYETSKGAIKFPIEKPLPLNLIKKIVKYKFKL